MLCSIQLQNFILGLKSKVWNYRIGFKVSAIGLHMYVGNRLLLSPVSCISQSSLGFKKKKPAGNRQLKENEG